MSMESQLMYSLVFDCIKNANNICNFEFNYLYI